jgi:hypothetical protein
MRTAYNSVHMAIAGVRFLFVVSFLYKVRSRGTETEQVAKVISLRSFNFGSFPGNVICTNVSANA